MTKRLRSFSEPALLGDVCSWIAHSHGRASNRLVRHSIAAAIITRPYDMKSVKNELLSLSIGTSRGGTPPSAAPTSQLGNGGTGVTVMGSLPDRSSSGKFGIAKSMAAREVKRKRGLLTTDGNQGGALTAVRRAVAIEPLLCPFKTILGCRKEFDIDHEGQWVTHSLSHFKKNGKDVEPPKTNKCCFCDKEILKSTGKESWIESLKYIRLAHHIHGHWMAADFELVRYLWGARVIDGAVFRDWTSRQSDTKPARFW